MSTTLQQLKTHDQIRRVIFSPYGRRSGNHFTLTMFDVGRRTDGKNGIGYVLRHRGKVLFIGDDFGCSPMHAIDSDAAVRDLMGFLTLRPGDTDDEYFHDYAQAQLDYCSEHAEALSMTVYDRFGED